MHKKCFSCDNFTEYYCKQTNRFAMSGYGNCKTKKQRVSRHSTCGGYKKRPEPPEINRAALFEKLEEVITDLNGIKVIFEERAED